MGVRMTTPMSEVQSELMAGLRQAERQIVRTLSYLGTLCVNRVRDRSGEESWFDDTGNLRSSIGFVIARDGHIVGESGFGQVRQGSEGSMEGRKLAEELARQSSSGYMLVIVAGMHYASYVEARDNKDVLASTELWARDRAPGMMEQLRRQVWKG